MPDVVILGGGIQGMSMALAAVEHGIRPIIVERKTLGSGASGNSYGIVHGGLRYLQTLSVARWHKSRRAQRWFTERFPDQVRPLRCVMPLYSGKARSPMAFAAARGMESAMEAILHAPAAPAPAGTMSRDQVLDLFRVPDKHLIGGAYWHDLELCDADAILQQMATRAQAGGATLLLNHDAEGLLCDCKVRGLMLYDHAADRKRSMHADMVIDCRGANAGYWSGSLSRGIPAPTSATLAFNLLLDMPGPPPGNAIAVSCVPGSGRSYFLRTQRGHVLAGTFYRPSPGTREARPTEKDIEQALEELRVCLPDIAFARSMVVDVSAGLLPDKDGTGQHMVSSDRHLQPLGPGYHILLSSKLTTAPLASEHLASKLWPAGEKHTHIAGVLQSA
ncbi:glycerol-3-phosphate dehydrogenase [Sphingobium sp. SCG-1]|uniref:FAD-dependent oxidoreductase n=1 Tax=Sphingobium sp. SCG-1 TaxID=2072936 RepID=UPI000CD6C4C7|nr:FAD-dependent oxidoreductase [Sphingobium sp. SCG-1]AUW58824.1 glycerol-3-phosphate dehydrogenase [Sphingobium sp. SCG-1]